MCSFIVYAILNKLNTAVLKKQNITVSKYIRSNYKHILSTIMILFYQSTQQYLLYMLLDIEYIEIYMKKLYKFIIYAAFWQKSLDWSHKACSTTILSSLSAYTEHTEIFRQCLFYVELLSTAITTFGRIVKRGLTSMKKRPHLRPDGGMCL